MYIAISEETDWNLWEGKAAKNRDGDSEKRCGLQLASRGDHLRYE